MAVFNGDTYATDNNDSIDAIKQQLLRERTKNLIKFINTHRTGIIISDSLDRTKDYE